MLRTARVALVLFVTATAALRAQAVTQSAAVDPAAARLFSAADALEINTYSIADLTDDGKWVALTHSIRRDGFGTDYRRDGDPTYVRISPSRLWAVDSRTGQRTA